MRFLRERRTEGREEEKRERKRRRKSGYSGRRGSRMMICMKGKR